MFPISALTGWISAILIAGAIAAIGIHFYQDSQTKDRLIAVTVERDTAKEKLGRAELAVKAVMQVNLENAQAREAENQRAKDAEARTAEAQANAEFEIAGINAELEGFRNRGLDCPAIDSQFRDWIRR